MDTSEKPKPEASPVASAGKRPTQRETPARGTILGRCLHTLKTTEAANSPGQSSVPLLTPAPVALATRGTGSPLAPAKKSAARSYPSSSHERKGLTASEGNQSGRVRRLNRSRLGHGSPTGGFISPAHTFGHDAPGNAASAPRDRGSPPTPPAGN